MGMIRYNYIILSFVIILDFFFGNSDIMDIPYIHSGFCVSTHTKALKYIEINMKLLLVNANEIPVDL
jgi:hypothetical protein